MPEFAQEVHMRGFATMLCTILVLVFAGWGTVRTVYYVLYERGAGGYLKRAADANTIALAKENLGIALEYIKDEGMTDGYTSVLWRTPDEDVGFWYNNLRASMEELESIQPGATSLEKSNVLMKLRETLLDQGEKSTEVTAPTGISIFPNNALFFWWGWLSFGLACVSGLIAVFADY